MPWRPSSFWVSTEKSSKHLFEFSRKKKTIVFYYSIFTFKGTAKINQNKCLDIKAKIR